MEQLLESLDTTAQRHLHTELSGTGTGAGATDLDILLGLLQRPTVQIPADISAALLLLNAEEEEEVEGDEGEEGEEDYEEQEEEEKFGADCGTEGQEDGYASPVAAATTTATGTPLVHILSSLREEYHNLPANAGVGTTTPRGYSPRMHSSGASVMTSASAPAASTANRHAPLDLPNTPETPTLTLATLTLSTSSVSAAAPAAAAGGRGAGATPSPRSGSATPVAGAGAEASASMSPSASASGSPCSLDTAAAYAHVTLDVLRTMVADKDWTSRAKCLTIMRLRLEEVSSSKGGGAGGSAVEAYLGMAITCAGDVHQKVAAEALQVIAAIVESHCPFAVPKLGVLLVALFHRLSDRRQIVRTNANALLNSIRSAFEPVAIVAALSPKILDLPERIKSAVVQYLSITVPHCGTFFIVPQNTLAFLGRIACVLGASGSSPSAALLTSGRRLVEMVYNVAPMVVLSQLGVLPIEQQTCLKRLLEHTVPELDALVTSAVKQARLDSIHPHHALPSPAQHASGGGALKANKAASPTARGMNATTGTGAGAGSGQAVLGTAAAKAPVPPVEEPSSHNLRDVGWLLDALADGDKETKTQALQEIKLQAKSASFSYWSENCAQIISVLLESFNPNSNSTTNAKNSTAESRGSGSNIAGNAASFTPGGSCVSADGSGYTNSKVNENWPPADGYASNRASLQACVVKDAMPTDSTVAAAPASRSSTKDMDRYMSHAECMHLACKALLLLVRHCCDHVVPFTDLLVSKLCQAAATAPVAVTLHCEQILIDLAPKNALRMLRGLVPYCCDPDAPKLPISPLDAPTASPPTNVQTSSARGKGTSPNTRLLALHVMADIMKCMPSSHLLPETAALVQAVLPSLTCSVVDLRKAAVFVLVETYMIIGDVLYPYVKNLPPPQRKLLTIYIDRHLKQSNK